MQRLSVILKFSLFCIPALAQTQEDTATRNITQLQTTISLDHAIYVPGEIATITIRIQNPTDRVLQIPAPFWPKRAGIDVLEKGTERAREMGQEYWYISPHPYSNYPPSPESPTVGIQPGEVMTQSVRTDEAVFSGAALLADKGVPTRPGEYRMVYSYDSRAHADFSVARPILEGFKSQVLDEESVRASDGSRHVVTHRVHAVALAIGDRHLVLRTLYARRPEKPRSVIGKEWSDGDAASFAPMERVAELDQAVTDLDLVVSSGAPMQLRWQVGNGRWNSAPIRQEPRIEKRPK